jgi:hypothetical protein
MDKIRNETIRTEMVMKKDVVQETEQQLRWRGCVMQMEDCRIARQVAEWNPQGNRRRGRPVSTRSYGLRVRKQRRNLRTKNVSIPSSGGEKIMSLD